MNKFKKWFAISACTLLAGACVASSLVFTSAQATETVEWSDVSLESEYVRDDVLTIPERSVKIGESSYDAEVTIRYPNGATRLSEGGELTLAETGKYTLIYEAKVSSKYYTEKEEFVVADKLWRVSNSKSSVTYGQAGNTNGLLVSLAKGDTLTFNKIIDVSNASSSVSLIEGFINPENVGMSEFERLVFTFTDVTDPTQTMTVICSRSQSSDNYMFMSYWTAAGNGQTQGGFTGDKFDTSNIFGLRGLPLFVSFYSYNGRYFTTEEGKPACESWADQPDSTSFKLAFDADTKEVVANGKNIADLDDAAYYEKEPIWNGFPSGRVRLSIQAAECSGETANFCISKLYSYDLTAENKFVEDGKPEIRVDVDEKYVQSTQNGYSFIPYAVLGGKYPVPTATAFDDYSGELSVETKVYFNYGDPSSRRSCAIQDGTFSVTKTGTYAIVYTATDDFGNVAEKAYWITAVKTPEMPLTIALPETIKDSGVCGETIVLAEPTVTGGSGANVGGVTVTTELRCGDEEILVTNGSFIPERAGKWTVRYIATDYSGIQAETSYTITVETGDIPVFVNKPTLWKYLISDMRYVTPYVYAYDYTSGTKTERLSDMILTDANGSRTYKAGEEFIPVATEAAPSVTLTFTTGGATFTETIPVVFPLQRVEDRTYVYIEKAFITENSDVVRDQSGLTLLATEDGNFSWSFINSIAASGASLQVKGIRGKSDFSVLNVTFTDSVDDGISVTMRIENTGSYAKILFGDADRSVTKGFNLGKDSSGNALDEFTFSYKSGKFYVDAIGVTVTTDDEGNAFNGFPSERVYVSAETLDAKSGNGYIVTSFDNHKISNKRSDLASPRIAIDGVYGGMYELNDTYVVTRAIVSDVVDACVRGYLTVKTPDGKIVVDESGVSLENVDCDKEYTIRLTQYGQYTVEYVATDYFGNKSDTISYTVNLFDRVSPSVSVANTWSATASVGERVILPEVSVSDNASAAAETTVYRYVRNPNGVVTTLGYDYAVNADGTLTYTKYAYTFRYIGEYRFVILVTDAAGNQTVAQYFVTVQ